MLRHSMMATCLFLTTLVFSLSSCGNDSGGEDVVVEEAAPENDNYRLFGTWTRDHKAGADLYIFEENGRFVRKTFGVNETEAATCSQGLYEAKNDILSLYVRGGNGGWKIEIQPYIVDEGLFSLTEVYQREAPTGEADAVSYVGDWNTFEDSYQILPEIAEPNPCEVPGQQSTPEILCCPDALSGITKPINPSSWPAWTRVDGQLSLNEQNASQFDWAKTDAKGNVYVDPKGGETEVSAAGTWTTDEGALYVSDESAVREYKQLTPTLMYEVSPSWIFSK